MSAAPIPQTNVVGRGQRRGGAVHIRNLVRRFGGRAVLDGISLDIAAGEFVALIGKSGSGKSTLLRALAHIDDSVAGAGSLQVPDNRSVLFQDSRLLPWEDVLQNITIGLRTADARARGLAVLADVGLAGRERAWPNALSGGEQQRVALARSLVRDPSLLLADEPFGALDALTRIRMHELLFRLVEIHRPTVLLVTHDVDEALLLAERVLVMDEGRVAVDRRVDLPHPRGKSSAAFEALRTELLAALGVVVHV
jgi:sulfonate transport system ATP-binding protein